MKHCVEEDVFLQSPLWEPQIQHICTTVFNISSHLCLALYITERRARHCVPFSCKDCQFNSHSAVSWNIWKQLDAKFIFLVKFLLFHIRFPIMNKAWKSCIWQDRQEQLWCLIYETEIDIFKQDVVLSQFRRLDTGFLLRSLRFNPGWFHVRFVLDEMAMDPGFLIVSSDFSLLIIIPPLLHTHPLPSTKVLDISNQAA
jgi:hypothetical protein